MAALDLLLDAFDESRHPRGWHGHWIEAVNRELRRAVARERNVAQRVLREPSLRYHRFTKSGHPIRTRPLPSRTRRVLDHIWHSKPTRAAKAKWAELHLALHLMHHPDTPLQHKLKLAGGIAAAGGLYAGMGVVASHLGPAGALIGLGPWDELTAGALLSHAVRAASGKHKEPHGGLPMPVADAVRHLYGDGGATETMHNIASRLTAGYDVPGISTPGAQSPRSRKFAPLREESVATLIGGAP